MPPGSEIQPNETQNILSFYQELIAFLTQPTSEGENPDPDELGKREGMANFLNFILFPEGGDDIINKATQIGSSPLLSPQGIREVERFMNAFRMSVETFKNSASSPRKPNGTS